MKLVTDYVLPDEPCFGMFEGPCMLPTLNGDLRERWVQDLKVVRGDQIHHYVLDFGPAEDFDRVTPMLMPSFGENTVAQLQEFAAKNREDDYWARRRDEMLESSTLIRDHLNQWEANREFIHNRSVFGPAITRQRNEYPRTEVWRRWYDERAAKTGKVKGYTRG